MSPERWLKIESVFQTAIDLPASRRDAFLAEECGDDLELCLEVKKLLASADSASGFIESPVWTDSQFLNTSAKKELSNSLDDHLERANNDSYLGSRIGAYRLTSEIGRGGMGAVYLAERADGEFNQKVAIKLIKRGMDSDFIIKRFRHERQILASFEHPFIARLLDGGTTDDSVPYFVMEYIQGETLYNYCDSKRLGIRDRLKIFQKVCSAIEYAHERQIVHRDIKPSNILINRTGSPKLLDFGIAKILDPNLIHESLNPTASMLRMMTPDYASPEQVAGSDVTPASDIYSLGILLYELLTGHRPYNFEGRALHEVSRVISEMMPDPPSEILGIKDQLLPHYSRSETRALQARATTEAELENDLSGDLDDIIMKAIAKDQGDRYRSAKDFSRDISRYLSGAKIEAPQFSAQGKKNAETFLRPPENSRAFAVLPFKFINLGPAGDTDDRFLGLGLADALITRLSKVRRFVVRPTSSILPFGEDAIDPIRAGRDLNVDYILDGNIKKAGDRLRVTVQLLNVAENAAVWATSIDEKLADVLTLEDTLSTKVIEVLLPQLTGNELEEFAKRGTDVPEAFEHYLRGRYHFNTFTEDGFAKAFVSFHSAIAADPNYARAYCGIADYYNWLGIMGVLPPQECFQPAIEAASKAVELDDNLSDAHASLGFSLHSGNYDWSRAEQHLRRAIELNPGYANAYVWYSIVLFTEGRFNEGLDFARRGVDLDPLTPFNQHNIGWGLYFARRYDEAASQYRKVVTDFPTYGFGYYGLSKIHRITGDTKTAIEENERVKKLMDASVFSLFSEAECFAADGQQNVAREKLARLEQMSADRYISPYQLALVYCFLGEKDRALESLERAEEIKEAWLNWMGVEPVLDILRGDPRFDRILENTGYRMFFSSFAASGTALRPKSANGNGIAPTEVLPAPMHDLTTLVIAEPDKTDDGIAAAIHRRKRRTAILAVASIFGILLVGSAIYVYLNRKAEAPPRVLRTTSFQNPALVVLPFTSNVSGSESLGVGLADALTHTLGNIKNLQVLSPNTGRAVAGLKPSELADQLDVAFVVTGNLSRDATGAATINAQLVNAAADEVMWSEQFVANDGDLLGLQAKLAKKIWSSLNIDPLPLERQQLEKSYTSSREAYEFYLIGRSQMINRSPENLRKAIETFSSSLSRDPQFALAYVGLADAYALINLYDVNAPRDAYPKSRENALKALAIDDNLAEAHASLGYVKFYHERDRSGAELEFRRAVQLNPSYAQAHHWFALALSYLYRPLEATSEAQLAQRLDPRSPSIKAATGIVYFMAERYQEALAECDKALAIDSGFVPALKVKRWVYTQLGDIPNARANFQKEMAYSGGKLEEPGWKVIDLQMVSSETDRNAAIAELERAQNGQFVKGNDYAFAFEIALAYNALGEKDKAIEWIERSEAAGSHSFNTIAVEPRIKNLKDDPRFRKLLAKLG
jgi:eukaryotic-like serine/threonine-protein kinase